MPSDPFWLLAAKLEATKKQMMADLNRDLFRSLSTAPVRPLTWRDRVRLTIGRVQRYIATLWRALKGDDPYDVDYDY